jgi:LmbE family N-acetylglucosaminyl deacetylase
VSADAAPVIAVSPHLDDAVLGCGALLAARPGATVVTVFAGRPPASMPLPPWDRASGFHDGDDVFGARRREDRAALALLDATPVWLDFLDAQYGASPPLAVVAAALGRALPAQARATLCVPLGLFHSDHALTHAAALTLVARHRAWRWLAYEEPTYRQVPGALPARLAALRAAGFDPVPCAGAPASPRKRRAIACYRSQLRALATPGRPGHAEALAAERYWELVA